MGDDKRYEVAVTLLYTFAIGVNVYLIVDSLTDGALSLSIHTRVTHLKQKVQTVREHRASVRADVGKVLWQATNIVEGTEQ